MNYLLPFLGLLLTFNSIAQRQVCGHQIHTPQGSELDYEPCASASFRTKWMHRYHQNPAAYQHLKTPNSTTYLPISLHIVGNDDSTGYASLTAVLNAFCRVNQDYKNTGIQFFIEYPIRYIENTAFNDHDSVIIGGGFMLQYNVPNTTNCYIVANPAGACGYNVLYGGLTVSQNCLTANTFSHELGHALGVQHTFFGWEGGHGYNGTALQNFPSPAPTEVLYDYTVYKDTMWGADTIIVDTTAVEYVSRTGPNANCNSAADGFCDTPADYLAFRWSCNGSNMSTTQQLDPDSVAFYSEGINIMSYSTCRSVFTTEQGQYMQAFIQAKRSNHLYNQSPIVDSISIANMALIEPAPNATLPTTVGSTFRWNKVDGATHYLLKICAAPCTTPGHIMEEILLTDTVYTSPLSYAPRPSFLPYRWQVLPFNQSYTCAGLTAPQSFNTQIATGLNDNAVINSFTIYPNPSQQGNNLTLEVQTSKATTGQLSLLSITGKTLLQEDWKLQQGVNQLNLPLTHLAAGVYLVYLEGINGKIIRKLVIEQ
ncbi:zinc-dependent metalloprotease [Aureispira anguillae]|uniref:Zinc-dependent metalloprotease n=1 Tax=Aureispira anguillae TaxID=2864201 RepID=A0A916DU52_9BACT|nr:zinc-dependent metalloprotease [Aureispira anguillae]BDS11981.1 zinc-dependent metalloprotease [Aureispira anguillae]